MVKSGHPYLIYTMDEEISRVRLASNRLVDHPESTRILPSG